MNFEHRITIPASRERVWSFLEEIPRVGRCVPGVTEVTQVDDQTYRGSIKVRVGPIGLTLAGDLNVLEQDEEAGKAAMSAQASDRKIGGAVSAKLSLEVREVQPTETELLVLTDATVMGRLGEFGQAVIRKKVDQMMGEFAKNLSAAVAAS